MNFDNPAWRSTPISTGIRVATSLLRREVPGLHRVPVPYDGGRTSIYADLKTPLGMGLYRYGLRDCDLDLLSRLLSPGDVFLDGGANLGLFTLVAADRVGPRGKVIAFEPGRAVRLRLLENVVLNKLSQVEVIPFALSERTGQASFRVFDSIGAGLNHLAPSNDEGGELETVGVTTIDAAVIPHDRDRLTLIKLDLEGAEYAALRGATATLQATHPDLLLEIEPTHLRRMGSSPDDIAGLLRERGYTFFRVSSDDARTPFLTPTADITAVPSVGPNIFATVNVKRAKARGVLIK
jgi:FkbM family methyltransferase